MNPAKILVLQAHYCDKLYQAGLPHQQSTPEIVDRYQALKAQGYIALKDVEHIEQWRAKR